MVNLSSAKSCLRNQLNDALDEQRRLENNQGTPVPLKDALGDYIDAIGKAMETLRIYESEQ